MLNNTLGRASQRALVQIIHRMPLDDMDNTSRHLIYKVNQETLEALLHSVEVPTIDGGIFTWHFLHPAKLIQYLMGQSSVLQAAWAAALRRNPPSLQRPWRALVGYDEFSPGRQLKVDNRRKVMVLSFTFLELGKLALRSDNMWITPVIIRTFEMNQVQGGWAYLFRVFMRQFLLGTDGGLLTSGVHLVVFGESVLLFSRLSNIISDGDGLRLLSSWRGACAIKPCFKHTNVVGKRSDLARRDPGIVDITCSDHTKFVLASKGYLENLMDIILEAEVQRDTGLMKASRYDTLLVASGFWPSNGILADRELRAHVKLATMANYDWVHTMFQDGVMTTEMWLLLSTCEQRNPPLLSFEGLEAFFKSGWGWPRQSKAKMQLLCRLFDGYRSRSCHKAEKLKGSSSETMGAYSLLRHFFETKLRNQPEIELQMDSFMRCCYIVDAILELKKGLTSRADSVRTLRRCLREYMDAHIRAYGTDNIRPKMHWLWDIIDQFEADFDVFDSLIVERIHLRIKKGCDPIENTRSFERSALAAYLHTHAKSLKDATPLGNQLRGRQQALPDHPEIHIADEMIAEGIMLRIGDIVLENPAAAEGGVASRAGEIKACLVENGEFFVVLRPAKVLGRISASSGAYRFEGPLKLSDPARLELAVAWYWVEGDIVVLEK